MSVCSKSVDLSAHLACFPKCGAAESDVPYLSKRKDGSPKKSERRSSSLLILRIISFLASIKIITHRPFRFSKNSDTRNLPMRSPWMQRSASLNCHKKFEKKKKRSLQKGSKSNRSPFKDSFNF